MVLTGAGISAESGIRTFRDSNGMWEEHRIEDVATPEGWQRNPAMVLNFYNERRRQLAQCEPNSAHIGLCELEELFEVFIITQNVDNLHERAGSSNVLHLHGELTKACNERKTIVEDIGYADINLGDQIAGTQMRPFIVWFGESVPAIDEAMHIVEQADAFVVIGTSLNVYPAAGLLNYVSSSAPIYLIDPNPVSVNKRVRFLEHTAVSGVKLLKNILHEHFAL